MTKTFIAAAPATYRPMIGAAIAIALADASRDCARRADGRPTTVPETLLDVDAGPDDRVLVLVLSYPDGTVADVFQGIEDAVLAGQYDPAGATPGMKQAVAAFRRAIAAPTDDDLEAILGSRPAHDCAGWDCANCHERDNAIRNLLAARDRADPPASRCVIAASVEGMIGGHDDDKVIPYPVAICDDGSVFCLRPDGSWRPRDPVPGTPADAKRQEWLKASRAADDIEE